MRTQLPSVFLAAALACSLFAAPAQATGAARTFVSAAGSDSNNCTNVATPCRHFAAAYAATAANGEIYVLDPANYGSLTITGPVSIEGHGWASIAPAGSNAAAITINALGATDKINIIGVVLDGTALTNTTGIQFNSGGSLTVRDSVIRNFGGNGISFDPIGASQLLVSNTLVSDNNDGINVAASSTAAVAAVFDHVTAQNNIINGIHSQSTAAQTINVAVSDSVIANNGHNGVSTFTGGGATVNVMVRNSTIFNNAGGSGLLSDGPNATIRVTRSTITANLNGWFVSATGVVTSYGDNNIDGNGSANTEPPSPLTYK